KGGNHGHRGHPYDGGGYRRQTAEPRAQRLTAGQTAGLMCAIEKLTILSKRGTTRRAEGSQEGISTAFLKARVSLVNVNSPSPEFSLQIQVDPTLIGCTRYNPPQELPRQSRRG